MHWNVILADASAAPSQTATAAPGAHGTQTAQPDRPGQSGPQSSPFGGIWPILILLLVIMYFMTIRPQQQRSKQMAKLMASLKSGDKVITSSGIIGIVITVKDKTVSLRSADAKMELTKSSITEIVQSDETQTAP